MIMGIGHKLRRIREIKNYSQDYIAQKLDISAKAYSKIENEETRLSVDRLYQLADILEVKPEDLLNFDEKVVIHSISNSGNGDGFVYNKEVSDNERESFQAHIRHLEEEIAFLRQQVAK